MAKKITVEHLRSAFSLTSQSRNCESLEDCMSDINGQRLDAVFEILRCLDSVCEHNFEVVLLESDCGVRDFMIIYSMDEFQVIISRFVIREKKFPFHTVEGMQKWLEKAEKKIALASLSLSEKDTDIIMTDEKINFENMQPENDAVQKITDILMAMDGMTNCMALGILDIVRMNIFETYHVTNYHDEDDEERSF